MKHTNLPDELKRFILRCIDSVPHLEAILIFHHEAKREWDAKTIAQNLYLSEKKAEAILTDLCESGFLISKRNDNVTTFQYSPKSLELEKIISDLDGLYVANLIEITNLIHSKVSKQAQTFGDAFKFQQE